ncbi:MAG: hypothetical protein DHS20C15_26900 [Planctomycetota bacterium]|nr:MAG: hypothetical protein DHS20C15_26900 [Planctomycetota bacterium]
MPTAARPSALRSLTACLGLLLLLPTLNAQLEVAGVFADHMVVQAGKPLPVWGQAAPRARVSVRLGDTQREARAGATGRWGLELPARAAGGPFQLAVTSGDESLRVQDILVGEVWIAAGGANMAFPVRYSTHAEAVVSSAHRPRVRFASVPAMGRTAESRELQLEWAACTPSNTTEVSAVAYAFACRLQDQLGVPVGIVQATFSFSRAAAWIPRSGLLGDPALHGVLARHEAAVAEHRAALAPTLDDFEAWIAAARVAFERGDELPEVPAVPRHPLSAADPSTGIYDDPTGLFNGMIAPLAPFAVRGVIWHQGEQDIGTGAFYATLQRALVQSWRDAWHDHALPWLSVQLSPYRYGENRPTEKPEHNLLVTRLPELWESQSRLSELPATGLIVTTDLGDASDLFMPEKSTVGRRLAAWALARTYGLPDIPHAFPRCAELTRGGLVDALTGDPARAESVSSVGSLVVRFADGTELRSIDGQALRWFEVAGADGHFAHARARAEGDRVRVWHDDLAQPVSVRYGWHQEAQGGLVNAQGLPAMPFRASLP